MDRREVLKSLISLPMVKSIEAARLQPNDVIVVECDGRVSLEQRKYIIDSLLRIWPERKILVCDGGLRIRIVHEA